MTRFSHGKVQRAARGLKLAAAAVRADTTQGWGPSTALLEHEPPRAAGGVQGPGVAVVRESG